MDLVKITWLDAQDLRDITWASKDDMEEFASKPCEMESVGWIYKKTKTYITICGDFGAEAHSRVEKIPRKMIVRIEPLQIVPTLVLSLNTP